jgi:hypothetical protein
VTEQVPGRLLDRAEVAGLLHVSEKTVARLAAAGHLDEIRVSAKSPRITPDSLERHLARHGVPTTQQGASAA